MWLNGGADFKHGDFDSNKFAGSGVLAGVTPVNSDGQQGFIGSGTDGGVSRGQGSIFYWQLQQTHSQ